MVNHPNNYGGVQRIVEAAGINCRWLKLGRLIELAAKIQMDSVVRARQATSTIVALNNLSPDERKELRARVEKL